MGLFRKKKLKKTPHDVVSYVLIEVETIKDANGKQMISSYCKTRPIIDINYPDGFEGYLKYI